MRARGWGAAEPPATDERVASGTRLIEFSFPFV